MSNMLKTQPTQNRRWRQILPTIIALCGAWQRFGLVLVLAGIMPGQASGKEVSSIIMLEDFQSLSVGGLPSKGWRARNGDGTAVYKVAQQGDNRFLQARDRGQSVQLFREGGWRIKSNHWLSWRWRVHAFPKDSNECKPGFNDSAAALYVVFPRRLFVPETIKYIWSREVPVGTVIRRHRRFPTIVVRSGIDGQGEWQVEQRNVHQDFYELFGRYPGKPLAIGFLSDADAVKGKDKQAFADYDDIRVSPVPFDQLPQPASLLVGHCLPTPPVDDVSEDISDNLSDLDAVK